MELTGVRRGERGKGEAREEEGEFMRRMLLLLLFVFQLLILSCILPCDTGKWVLNAINL